MSHRHMSTEERFAIAQLQALGLGHREIGRRLGRHHSTIGRELRRNRPRCGTVCYDWQHADGLAERRRRKPRHRRRRGHRRLWNSVMAGLSQGWSPEQIAGRLRRDHRSSRAMRIAPETIYQWIYRNARDGGGLWQLLRRAHKRRRKHCRLAACRGRFPGRRSIHERPGRVARRQDYGHWEGDTLVGGRHVGGILTLIERKSRFLVAQRLPSRKAMSCAAALSALLAPLPARLRRTLTVDNGKEFAAFNSVEEQTGVRIYFADPYAAWQRGCNENANGLLRQYVPKGTEIDAVCPQQLANAVEQINNRPRKCLGYKSPAEVFHKQLRGALGT